MNNRVKQIIFDKLYEDLKHVELISYDNSIWFIDREKKYWYIEYRKYGALWWRWPFFPDFFALFSMEQIDFEPIIVEWVEEVLNYKIKIPILCDAKDYAKVEDVLDYKVETTEVNARLRIGMVEKLLNYRIETSIVRACSYNKEIEEVLKHMTKTPYPMFSNAGARMEEVLNHKAN